VWFSSARCCSRCIESFQPYNVVLGLGSPFALMVGICRLDTHRLKLSFPLQLRWRFSTHPLSSSGLVSRRRGRGLSQYLSDTCASLSLVFPLFFPSFPSPLSAPNLSDVDRTPALSAPSTTPRSFIALQHASPHVTLCSSPPNSMPCSLSTMLRLRRAFVVTSPSRSECPFPLQSRATRNSPTATPVRCATKTRLVAGVARAPSLRGFLGRRRHYPR
jgi:hypothetical protein